MGFGLTVLLLALVGIVFCLLYYRNKEGMWWAIIPGLAGFTVAAALLSDPFTGPDPANDWIQVLILGIGTAVNAALVSRASARVVLIIVAMFMFAVGFAMAPAAWLIKGALIVASVVVGLLLARRAQAR